MDVPGEKLLIKLWETLADKGVGSLLTPWQLLREGRARNQVRRQELLMLAQAERDISDVRAGRAYVEQDGTLHRLPPPPAPSSLPLLESGHARAPIEMGSVQSMSSTMGNALAAKSEINASKAVIFAEEQLAGDPQSPPERQVEEDWLFSWREYAGRVSVEDLQRLWGSVLAGEVKSPGSYSLRTLDFLKSISKSEAEAVSKLASFVVEGQIVRSAQFHLEANGISFNVLLKMQELGVVSGVEAIGLQNHYKSARNERYVFALRSNGKALIVEHEDPTKVLQLEVYLLTGIGAQVLGLGSFTADIDYLRVVGKGIVGQGFTVNLVDWVQISENEGRYSNSVKLEA